MSSRTPYLFAAVICVVFAATSTHAERKTHPAGAPAGTASPPPDMTLQSADLSQSPGFKAASKVAPVAPEKLQPLLTEKLDKWKRIAISGKVNFVGPAAYTEVSATYELRRGNNLDVQILDPAGLPQEGAPYETIPEPGWREESPGQIREGVAVQGFKGLVVQSTDGHGVQAQFAVGPRIRLLVQSATAKHGEVLAAIAAIDLQQMAALAPNAPPTWNAAPPEPAKPAAPKP